MLTVACSERADVTGPEIDLTPVRDMIIIVQNGCPSPFNLVSWKNGLDPDRNGDGAACEHVVYLTNEKLVTYIDNNIPANQVGGCPKNFDLGYSVIDDPRDRNANGLLCTMVTPNSQVIIDDNVQAG